MIGSELDLLPDKVEWRDEGCEFFPSCLNCPLPRCVEDEPRGQQRLRMAARKRRMAELRRRGKSVKEIAELFGVSRRTVQRAFKKSEIKDKRPKILRIDL
jgi:methylphosphotriester-DNA--protein-cysteine methyltransferase